MPKVAGLYTGLDYISGQVDSTTDVANMDALLDRLTRERKENSVVSVFVMPTQFYTTSVNPVLKTFNVKRPTKIGTYKPRNNKLLTYPYMFLLVDTLNDNKVYRYEWKTDTLVSDEITFNLRGTVTPNPEIVCYPVNYNGVGNAVTPFNNPTEQIVCSGFPQVAFTIDSYNQWLANKGLPSAVSGVGSAVMTGLALSSGNIIGGALGAVGMAQQFTNLIMQQTKGNGVKGSPSGSVDVAAKLKDIYFKQMSVTEEYAEMIDGFFDRYGYACCKVTYPNIDVRPKWCYVKTRDMELKGDVPVEAIDKIKSIFNNGITFWKNGDEVGNYYLDNRIPTDDEEV